jgi:signal transduction histidine kinase
VNGLPSTAGLPSLTRTIALRTAGTVFAALGLVTACRVVWPEQPLSHVVGVALLATLAAMLGAGFLARAALRPVEEIARQADLLEANRTGGRIDVPARVRECEDLVRVLNAMLERRDLAFDWQRRLIGNLGHDLRTPITTLRASTEMALRAERAPERYRAVLEGNLEEIDRLALMSDALLLLARFQAGALVPHAEPFDLGALADEAVERARRHRQGRGGGEVRLELPADASPRALTVAADRRMVELQLDELLDNALRHTPAGTPVRVRPDVAGGRCRFVVEDGGPGVPEEQLSRLFELGFRADAARGRAAGAGLGLTVVAAIAEAHGGRVTADRGELGGLRVAVELPLAA